MRLMRAYAAEPDKELKNTVVIEIAVTAEGESEGNRISKTGVSKKPPPAPISVPKAPTTAPNMINPVTSSKA
jgi:hypothetical protein